MNKKLQQLYIDIFLLHKKTHEVETGVYCFAFPSHMQIPFDNSNCTVVFYTLTVNYMVMYDILPERYRELGYPDEKKPYELYLMKNFDCSEISSILSQFFSFIALQKIESISMFFRGFIEVNQPLYVDLHFQLLEQRYDYSHYSAYRFESSYPAKQLVVFSAEQRSIARTRERDLFIRYATLPASPMSLTRSFDVMDCIDHDH